jgi:hypothetical protein
MRGEGPIKKSVRTCADVAWRETVGRFVLADEHLALLEGPPRFERLYRKDDLLDEEVSAIFGLEQEQAELLALCFRARTFKPGQAETWLRERGFHPVLFLGARSEP